MEALSNLEFSAVELLVSVILTAVFCCVVAMIQISLINKKHRKEVYLTEYGILQNGARIIIKCKSVEEANRIAEYIIKERNQNDVQQSKN